MRPAYRFSKACGLAQSGQSLHGSLLYGSLPVSNDATRTARMLTVYAVIPGALPMCNCDMFVLKQK